MNSGTGERCLVSDPRQPHFLGCRKGRPRPPSGCFICGEQDSYQDNFHYYCATCDLQFHRGCHLWPRERRHPFHLQHQPLSFSFLRPDRTFVSDGHIRDYFDRDGPVFDDTHGECGWCGGHLKVYDFFYRCSVCGFSLCRDCSGQDPPLTVTNPNTHPHPLTFFPRPISLPCDACGSPHSTDPPYVCHLCHYVVHQACLYLPRVIRITRHPHRLSRLPYLYPANLSCRVCHSSVDPKYGAFSCTRGCPYALHSKCATRRDIWDGKELEGEPEEDQDEAQDIEPFVKIGDKEIKHFSHNHHLHLNEEEDGGVGDANHQCQACVLPVDMGSFYSCKQCDFLLHPTCASLPRKKYHELHRHPLVLDPLPPQTLQFVFCAACQRVSFGFSYKCAEKKCSDLFMVDARCASVSEPFVHKNHQHPLFIEFVRDEDVEISCSTCGGEEDSPGYYLKCFDACDFVMCFECSTLPNEVRYKFDDHPLTLTLCFGKDTNCTYWCEECEEKLDPQTWFYTCNECGTTVHVSCMLGTLIYVKVGCSFRLSEDIEVVVVRNNSTTRPICSGCRDRCRGTIIFKVAERCFCSLKCLAQQFQETDDESEG